MSSEAQQFKAQGNAAFSKGDNPQAVEFFTKAIEIDSTDHVFFSNRSAAYAAMSDYENALKDAESCVKLAPTWAKGYSRLGLALFNLSKYDEAKKAYSKGLEIEPENSSLKEGLAEVEAEMSAAKNPFGKLFGPDIWAKIQMNPKLSPFLSDPSFVQKVQMLQKSPSMISGMMNDPKIQALFGALLGLGDSVFGGPEEEGAAERPEEKPAKPERAESKAHEPAPETSQAPEVQQALAQKEAGNAAYKKRDFATALDCYEKALQLDPKNPVLLLNIAAVKLESNLYQDAIDTCQKCIEMCLEIGGQLVTIGKAYGRIGSAYQKMGDLVKAIQFYEKSLVENFDRAIEKKLKETKKAKEDADRVAYLDENKALEHKEKGNALFQEGNWTGAIAEYTEAIRRNPNDHKSYSNRAACYTKLMEWGKALDDVDKALLIDPNFVKAYIRKGKIQTFLKQYHKARDTYKAGLVLDPECSDLLEGLRELDIAIHSENISGEIDPERQARAMADPEVQKILQDPQLQNILQQMQSDPQMAQKALSDPAIRKKIEVLVDAGILRVK